VVHQRQDAPLKHLPEGQLQTFTAWLLEGAQLRIPEDLSAESVLT